jgi:hypothetical protein
MKPWLLFAGLFLSTVISGPAGNAVRAPADTTQYIQYSLAEAEPYPQEIGLAYRRLWKFLQRPNAAARASLQETAFVAVQVGEFSAADVPRVLARLERGKGQATTFYGSDPNHPAEARLQFLIVFDWRTRRPIGPVGFFVNDTPNRGKIGKFGDLLAVYAGTG